MRAQLLEHLFHVLDAQVHSLDIVRLGPAHPHAASHPHSHSLAIGHAAAHAHARPSDRTTAHALHATAHGLPVLLHQFLPLLRSLAGHPALVQLLHFGDVLLPLLLGRRRRFCREGAGSGNEQQGAAAKRQTIHLHLESLLKAG
ncbi:hypothetical protein D3C84_1000920 [compost metagenome]